MNLLLALKTLRPLPNRRRTRSPPRSTIRGMPSWELPDRPGTDDRHCAQPRGHARGGRDRLRRRPLCRQGRPTLSEKVGLQTAAERSGLAESMQHMGIPRNVPAIVGTIVFWGLMLVFLMASFSILDIPQVSGRDRRSWYYIPNLLVATVVVVVGLLVASFFRGVIATSADRVGISYAEHLGQRLLLRAGPDDLHGRVQPARAPVRPA